MFETKIRSTKFTGPLADCMFRRINGSSYEEDVTFLSTLRVLLMNRMQPDDSITLQHVAFGIIKEENVISFSNAVSNHAEPDNQLTIINCTVGDMATEEEKATCEELFDSFAAPPDYHEFVDVKAFFAEKMKCRAFVNETKKSAIVVVLNLTMRKYHLIQCITPKLLPWFFSNTILSVLERDLLYSLRSKFAAEYERILLCFCDTEQFRLRSSSAALAVFKRRGLEKQKIDTEQKISSINNNIESYNSELLRFFRQINELNFKLNGILSAMNSEDSSDNELATFLAGNRNIDLISIEEDSMTFAVKGYLDIYDPEIYQNLANNNNCWYWGNMPRVRSWHSTVANRKLLLNAIFGDNPVFKLKTVGVFTLYMDSNTVQARSSGGFYTPYRTEYYPNPHLYHNSCLGAHRAPINRLLSKGDLVGAISQCISSTHSVNVSESASFRYVCQDLFTCDYAVLEDANGQTYTPEQAFRHLRSQNNSAE